jgi:hypothetical protein
MAGNVVLQPPRAGVGALPAGIVVRDLLNIPYGAAIGAGVGAAIGLTNNKVKRYAVRGAIAGGVVGGALALYSLAWDSGSA